MPATLILTVIYGDMLLAAAALGTFGLAAATFGIRLITTMVISNIIAKRQMGDISDQGVRQIGNRVQLPPSTDNKIGVVYGSAYMKPIVVDAKISTDNQLMWYVLVFSESMDNDSIGTFSFGDIYWGDKKMNFDETDQTRVVSWVTSDGITDTKVDGNVNIWLYRDGSDSPINSSLNAWEVLQDTEITEAQRWDTDKKMSKLCFAIVKIKYNQDSGITGLAEISAVINNSLTKPGDVIKDYLTNSRYGAGLSVDRINLTTLTELNTYSDEYIYYTPSGGGSQQYTSRYRINGPIDTTKNFLDNLNQICDSCDTWLGYNEKDNKWNVIVNRSVYDLDPTGAGIRLINSSNLIGGINLNPMDLNQSYNSVEVQFPNTQIRDQPGYHLITLDSFPLVVRNANEPDNKLGVALPYTNNIIQAQYIAARRLLQSREDLSVTFTMDHSGIQVDAGDIIAITHERYGWTNKFFRVTQVQETKSQEGSLFAQILASEYNDGVYDDNNIDLQDFTLDLNTGITDPGIVGTPNQPYIDTILSATAVPTFNVNTVIPSIGTVIGVEYWYATTATITDNNYTLWTTGIPSSGSIYNAATTATATISSIDTGDYYWRVRLVGVRSKSEFSAPSDIFSWTPNPVGTLVGQNFASEFVPAIWNIRQDSTGTIYLGGTIPRLYGQSGGGLINYSGATSDNDTNFVNNSWRIGSTTSTWVQGIVTTGVTINLSSVANQTTYAQFATPTAVSTSGGVMTVPVRYKNSMGEIYQGIPAQQRFAVLRDGTNGTNGFNGSNGSNGTDGFANFVYVPIGIEPAAASNAQRTAAWLAATNRNPVYNDNGTFYGPTTRVNYSYYGTSTQWVAATVFIDGDLVSTGTIRGAALVADAIYGKTFQSNNGYVGSYGSPGAWIDGTNGNARFAGTMNIGNSLTVGNNATIGTNLSIGDNLIVGDDITIGQNAYIGANLTVAGLINNGSLGVGVVTSSTLATDVRDLITAGSGGTPSTQLGTPNFTSSNSWNSTQYDWHYTGSSFVYGHWRTVGYSNALDSHAGKTVNVGYSCNLTFSGANAYPNGPIFFLFLNYNNKGGSNVTYLVPVNGTPIPTGAEVTNGSTVSPQFGSSFGSSTSYNAAFSISGQLTIPSGKTGVIIGVGFINGNGTTNPGTFSTTGNTWSITQA